MRFMMFSKHLQSLPLQTAAQKVRELGFEGLDLTVRPGGFVEPAQVQQRLPAAIATCADAGLKIGLLTTSITDSSDPYAAKTFEAAAANDVREVKLGYWNYETFGSYRDLLSKVARDIDSIAKVAEKTGVRANVHIHSGNHMTASAPVVWSLIKDHDPRAIGAYIDPGHMMIEGGRDLWRQGIDLLRDRISLVAIKDLTWEKIDDAALGKSRWISHMVPLRQGIVPWPRVIACLKQVGFDGWLSFHSEYQGWHSWRDLSVEQLLQQTKDDLSYFHSAIEIAEKQPREGLTSWVKC
jgi:sugar phosphate isomerase/epimerase